MGTQGGRVCWEGHKRQDKKGQITAWTTINDSLLESL